MTIQVFGDLVRTLSFGELQGYNLSLVNAKMPVGHRKSPVFDCRFVFTQLSNQLAMSLQPPPSGFKLESAFDCASLDKGKGEAVFRFPSAIFEECDVQTKHYVDADIEEVESNLKLSLAVPRSTRVWIWALCLPFLLIVCGGVFAFRRFRKVADIDDHGLKIPEQITPFTVLNYLRRVQADWESCGLRGREQELSDEINTLEKQYFSPNPVDNDQIDIREITERWSASHLH